MKHLDGLVAPHPSPRHLDPTQVLLGLREVRLCLEHGTSAPKGSGICWMVKEARATRITAGNDKCRIIEGEWGPLPRQ